MAAVHWRMKGVRLSSAVDFAGALAVGAGAGDGFSVSVEPDGRVSGSDSAWVSGLGTLGV